MSNKKHLLISKTAIKSRQKKSSALQHIMDEAVKNHTKKQQECINKTSNRVQKEEEKRFQYFSIYIIFSSSQLLNFSILIQLFAVMQ